MIKVTLNDVRLGANNLSTLLNETMNARTAFKITKISKALESEYAIFLDGQNKLVAKYAEMDENGQPVMLDSTSIKIQQDKIAECNRELQELLNTEVELNVPKLSLDEIDALQLSPNMMNSLMPFIEE